MDFSADSQQIAAWMEENREMRRIIEEEENFELSGFYDVRDSLKRVRLEGTWRAIRPQTFLGDDRLIGPISL